MTGRICCVLLMACTAGVAPLRAEPRRLTGVIVSIDREPPSAPTIQVSSPRETRTVRTDRRTRYVKWVTQKPWQQNTNAEVTGLVEGGCIEVELRSDRGSAKVIRISDEPPGSFYDPCKVR